MLIAKAKKSHTVGEELVKPAALLMIRRILGEEAEKKLTQMPLSNSTEKNNRYVRRNQSTAC